MTLPYWVRSGLLQKVIRVLGYLHNTNIATCSSLGHIKHEKPFILFRHKTTTKLVQFTDGNSVFSTSLAYDD